MVVLYFCWYNFENILIKIKNYSNHIRPPSILALDPNNYACNIPNQLAPRNSIYLAQIMDIDNNLIYYVLTLSYIFILAFLNQYCQIKAIKARSITDQTLGRQIELYNSKWHFIFEDIIFPIFLVFDNIIEIF